MRKYWLMFAQATTIVLAMFFVVHTLRPELLPSSARSGVVTLYESPLNTDGKISTAGFSEAAKKVTPTVVNIFTTTIPKTPRHPFSDDPAFRFFFGDPNEDGEDQPSASLGSGVIVSK